MTANRIPTVFVNESSVTNTDIINQADALLPQTQCGLCGYEDGCLPYATAIVTQNEAANKCVPGGQPVADALAALLLRENQPAAPSKWQVQPNGRPQEVRAVIREDECIGCTKCIPACPVDAIIGASKQMHTVFTDLCTGCELCLAPCPVDCIDLVPIKRELSPEQRITEQNHLRSRYQAHLQRLTDKITAKGNQAPVINSKMARITQQNLKLDTISADDAKLSIETAKLRTKIKKLEKQLSVRVHANKQAELEKLHQELSKLTAK